MMQLFVEGRPVDVNESFSTVITLAIDDIKEFGSRNSTFSKTIILPGTKRNNVLFGNIFEINAANDYNNLQSNIGANFNAAVSASCYIFNDNIQQVKGIFRILEVVIDDGMIEYECSVVGELGGFAAKMGNKKLEELDFSAYNHAYTLANITGSWANASAGTGYYYPLIDYGNYSTNKHDWQYKTFRPAFFAKEYIDKIFATTGYSYDCALFNTTRFESLIIPNNQKKLSRTTTNFIAATSSAYNILEGNGVDPVIDKAQIVTSSTITSNFTATGGGEFQYTGVPTITVNIRMVMSGTTVSDSPTTFYVGVKDNSTDDYSTSQFRAFATVENTGSTLSEAFSFTLDFQVTLNTNDYLRIYVCTSVAVGSGQIFTFNGAISSFSVSGTIATLVDAVLGDSLTVNDIIPKNILQKDFISSIMKLWNLYLFEDRDNDRLIKIKPFVDYYLDATAVDWSSKIDRSKPQRIRPMSELNSRYFEFVYADDSDYWNDLYKKRYNESYGSYKYDSEFEFAKEVQKVDLIFAGTPLVGYGGEDKVYSTIFKRTGETSVIEENTDSKIRLVQAKLVSGVTSWDILNGASVLGSYTTYGYAGHFDDPDNPGADLNFGVVKELFFTLATGDLTTNQFNVYWSSYMAEITDKDSRMLMCTMKLNYRDIYNLDFAKLIWIDGVLYRLNKIEDFNVTNEDTCKVELLKIINRIY